MSSSAHPPQEAHFCPLLHSPRPSLRSLDITRAGSMAAPCPAPPYYCDEAAHHQRSHTSHIKKTPTHVPRSRLPRAFQPSRAAAATAALGSEQRQWPGKLRMAPTKESWHSPAPGLGLPWPHASPSPEPTCSENPLYSLISEMDELGESGRRYLSVWQV